MSVPRPGLAKYAARSWDVAKNPTLTASNFCDMVELLTLGQAEVDSVDPATGFTALLFLVSLNPDAEMPESEHAVTGPRADDSVVLRDIKARAIDPPNGDYHQRCMELLLSHGANPTFQAQGETAIDIAKRRGHRILPYILERAAAVGYEEFEAERAQYRLEIRLQRPECRSLMERARGLFAQAGKGGEGPAVGHWRRNMRLAVISEGLMLEFDSGHPREYCSPQPHTHAL